jgi:hypothetical protein
MPSLSELQTAMARALLAPDPAGRRLPGEWFSGHAERGQRTHRNNVVGACCNALRLCYPTLERLIGSEHFDALAAGFVRSTPPVAPTLSVYGEDFARFVAARAATEDSLLLQEVARFDWLFERVAQAPVEDFSGPVVALEGGVQLCLSGSLRLHRSNFPVDRLRAGAEAYAGAETGAGASADAAVSGVPKIRHLALWRRSTGVAVQELHPQSAAFLAALLADAGIEVALAAAAEAAGPGAGADELSAHIESDIFRASFVRLTPH